MPAYARNLIISPIGKNSVHGSWTSQSAVRTYDLLLINYSTQPGFGAADATHYLERQGMKWELMSYALDTLPDIVAQYKNVWLPDDDIRASPSQINRLFALFEEYRLQLAQPAIAAGEVSYKVFRQRPGIILRYTPLVELMCPLFTRDALRQVSATFVESRSGWGLDVIWPRLFAADEVAIIDAVGVEHTRPVGKGAMYRTLSQQNIDPRRELADVVARHGGFDAKFHHRLVRGTIKLPAIRHPAVRVNWLTRAMERLGLRRAVA
jgi:hypothetical protein